MIKKQNKGKVLKPLASKQVHACNVAKCLHAKSLILKFIIYEVAIAKIFLSKSGYKVIVIKRSDSNQLID